MGLGSIPAFGIVFENCEVSWNRNSPGIWFDYCNPQTPEEGYVLYPDDPSHPRIQVKHNYIHDNGGDGILFEVSSHGLVYDNFLENNFGSGIALSTSCDIRILNNTILAPAVAFNSPVPLLIGQVAGGRSDYFSRDNRVLNNVMVTPNNQAVVAIQVAHAGTGETNQVRNNVFASNIYYSSFRPGGAQLNVAPLNIRATGYHSMAAWRKASGVGDEGSSNDRDPKSIDPELISRRGPAAPQTWPGPIVP